MAEEDPLHIGNVLTILSTKYGLLTGRIVYRDLDMVRLMDNDHSDRATEFPLVADGSTFIPELGVSDIEIIERQESPCYVDTIGAKAGETLEFFTLDGTEAAPNGVVAEIIKTATKDSIRLEDGRIIKFKGKGPELPIAVVRVTASEIQGDVGQQGPAAIAGPIEPPQDSVDVLALLRGLLPAATVEVVPSAERVFPDSMQREDMLQDLLTDIPAKQRTNPRRIRFIEREVELALALKNRSIIRDETGRSLGPDQTSVTKLRDAITHGVPAAIPIVVAAKVLNIDSVPPEAPYKATDVFPRSLAQNESDSEMLAKIYLDGASPEFQGAIAEKGKGLGFFSYMYDLFERDGRTLQGSAASPWSSDQDVIRTAGLGAAVQGLSKELSSDATVTPAFLLSDITDRSMRVLTADTSVHIKTGARSIVAPADPSQIAGYVMLPIKAALSLRPPSRPGHLPMALIYSAALENDNLPTIATTLRDLYSGDVDVQHAWTLDPTSDIEIADWLRTVLPYAVHPSDSLGPRTPAILSVLDALGVGHADLSPPVNDVIQAWITKNQGLWSTLFTARRAAVQAALDTETAVTFDNVTGDSLLFARSERKSEALQELLDSFDKQNPSLVGSASMATGSLLTTAQGDGLPLMWSYVQKADDLTATIDEAEATAALRASQAAYIRRQTLKISDLKAAPEISTCPHVERLEAVRNVPDVLQKSRLLRDFIETYQGPRAGDWMTCALCTGGCVCYHEIMELEALAQPSRLESIQKQIMIKFGGDRYQGKIVCKNCGQALQDIDYDEHVEFSDDGKAVISRSVLTEEQLAEVTEGVKLSTPAALTFASVSQRAAAEALQVIVDRAGIRMPEDITRRIVRHVDLYVGARAPPPALYETQRARAMTSASTKIKKATGTEVATIDVPTYAAVLDQLRVTALTGLVALALQTSNLEVTTPFPLCEFSRGGWPLDPKAVPTEKGAVFYMSCVVASIQRDMTPWRNLSWATLPKLESRRTAVLKATIGALTIIVTGDPKTGALSFGPEIRTDLVRAQTDIEGLKERALVSRGDQLTPGFRPEANPKSLGRPAIEKSPLPNVEAALLTGKTFSLIAPLKSALTQQALAVISELHKSATTSTVSLQEAAAGSLVVTGQPDLAKAFALIQTVPTHLWQQTSEATTEDVVPTLDEAIFFKLFLRFCYTGPQVGHAHEFSFGHVCRQCDLALGKPLDLINFDKEGAAILAGQEGPLKIEVTAAAFEGLSTAIRRLAKLTSVPSAKAEPWQTGLRNIIELAKRPEMAAFGLSLTTIIETPLTGLDDMARAELWGPIAVQHDELKTQIIDRVGPFVPRQAGRISEARAREAITAMAFFDTLTEDPFVEGPRNLLEYWCTKVGSVGRGFGVTSVAGAKWFKISQDHNDRINKLLVENTNWYAGDLPDAARPVLIKVATTLGPFIRTWISSVRPGSWRIEEARLVLRTIVYHVWRDALSTTSWMYEEIEAAAVREQVATTLSDWTRALMLHAKQQVFKYSKEQIQQILQQRAELERTSVVKEFEDIKDEDQRAAELIKKSFRIGRWGVGKNLQKYNADLFEFESEQRARMGIADQPVDPLLLEGAGKAAAEDFGLGGFGAEEAGYDVDQDTSENA